MQLEDLTSFLTEIFGSAVQHLDPESWQVDTPEFRLLILLSEDLSWLRLLLPIAPLAEVQSLLAEVLEANFDFTQEARLALHQGVVWAVFQHSLITLQPEDLSAALGRLVVLQQRGISECFNLSVQKRIREIIQIAKQQGQSLETTLQNLDHLYQEGVMGDMDQDRQSLDATLAAWRYQLERLWSEVNVD